VNISAGFSPISWNGSSCPLTQWSMAFIRFLNSLLLQDCDKIV
jgi:hypothetical protein